MFSFKKFSILVLYLILGLAMAKAQTANDIFLPGASNHGIALVENTNHLPLPDSIKQALHKRVTARMASRAALSEFKSRLGQAQIQPLSAKSIGAIAPHPPKQEFYAVTLENPGCEYLDFYWTTANPQWYPGFLGVDLTARRLHPSSPNLPIILRAN